MRGGQQRRRRRWFTAGLAAAALAAVASVAHPRPAAAKPGVVTNFQGQTFAGDVTEDDKFVYVNAPGGQLRLDKRNVAKVDYAADIDEQYTQRHAKLGGNDIKGRIDLAHWANEHGRPDLAIAALEEARQIDPANRDVALTLDAIQRQMDLDRRQGHATVTSGKKQPGFAVATTRPATGPAVSASPVLEHRLLTMAEVNLIRQVEMRTDDRLVKVRLENGVGRRYVKASGYDAGQFAKLSGEEQALEILKYGTPDMAKDVRILTDPTPLHLFKTKVMPIIALSCGSTACHGGVHAGDLALYTGETAQAVYTNFYILQTYAAEIGGIQYTPLDREVPERSLVLQFGLPAVQGRPPHPAVPDWRPRFKNRTDAAYETIDNWLTYDLRVIQPDYGFDVSARLLPSTRPAVDAAAASTMPTTAAAGTPPAPPPEAHGVPLPRLPNGAVTQPSR